MQDKLRERVSVKDFGAVGNGTNNDAASIQAAINYANTIGADVDLGIGTYYCGTTGLVLNNSSDTGRITPRANLIGRGMRQTVLNFDAGNFVCIAVTGGSPLGSGVISNQEISGIYVNKADNNGYGIVATDHSGLTLRNCYVIGSGIGIVLTDVISSSLYDCSVLFANVGLTARRSSFSSPNAISFYNCKFGNCNQYGADFSNSTTVNFFGGSFESNGAAAGDLTTPSWGVRLAVNDDTHIDGSVAANFYGTYFENNGNVGDGVTPTGDIWYVNSSSPGSMNVIGCTFQRHSRYTKNCVRVETSGTPRRSVNVIGCGFRGFSDYTASASRPYVYVTNPTGNVRVTDLGNTYNDATERPVYAAPYVCANAVDTAWVRFNGAATTPTPVQQHNVASITKNGTGDYTINYARPLASGSNAYTFMPIGAIAVADVTDESTTYVRVRTWSLAGAAVDVQLSVGVKGGSDFA